jgi:cysteine-rich repeat protein
VTSGSNGGGTGSTSSGTGGIIIIFTTPDAAIDQPATSNCGNGVLDQSEQCDDGNSESSDGCSRICQIENNFECPTPGQLCVNMAKCGNGTLTSDESCDDGNTLGGDGCSADCKSVETGWQCRVPGKACTPKCGDGVLATTEACDDGNSTNGDGCSATCRLESGFKCEGSPSKCSPTTCGDGKMEGAEGCDDGNTMPFDGCSQECQIEPDCSGASCASKCGDGIVLNELCDDGNAASGDGCSSDCTIEPGWTCNQPALGDKMLVPVIYAERTMVSNTVQTDARLAARVRIFAEMAAWIPTGASNATSPRRMASNWTAAVSLRPMSPPRSTAPQRVGFHPISCSKVHRFPRTGPRLSHPVTSQAVLQLIADGCPGGALPLGLGGEDALLFRSCAFGEWAVGEARKERIKLTQGRVVLALALGRHRRREQVVLFCQARDRRWRAGVRLAS